MTQQSPPIPQGMETAYTFESGSNRTLPMYEGPCVSNSGEISPPLDVLASRFFEANKMEAPAMELARIRSINPAADILLADYRALRLRLFFSNLATALLNTIVSPDGKTNAARLLMSNGERAPGVFSELARVLMAALLSGKDESIAAALRVYFMSVMQPKIVTGSPGKPASISRASGGTGGSTPGGLGGDGFRPEDIPYKVLRTHTDGNVPPGE